MPFFIAIAIGIIFYRKAGVICVGVAVMIFAGIVARFRWKFVYGSEEYRQSVRRSYEISKTQPRSGSRAVVSLAAMIWLISFLIVTSFLNKEYFVVLVFLGVEVFFIFLFIIETCEKYWDLRVAKNLFILIVILFFYGIFLFLIRDYF